MSRAQAGLEVVLIDRDQEAADKGKAHSDKLISDRVKKGRAMQGAERDALLARITPTAGLCGARRLRSRHRGGVRGPQGEGRGDREGRRPSIGDKAIFALQHLDAADHLARRANSRTRRDFIGIHFFSPVDRMMLVEIILGKKTGDKALATALDYVRAIRKTPIVVNDSRGFYTSRVRRHLYPRRPPDADRGRAGGDDRECRPHGRHAGRPALRSTTRSRSTSPGRS